MKQLILTLFLLNVSQIALIKAMDQKISTQTKLQKQLAQRQQHQIAMGQATILSCSNVNLLRTSSAARQYNVYNPHDVEFLDTCTLFDKNKIKKLIQNPSLNINAKHPQTGDSALHISCLHESPWLTKLILKYNPNIEIKNNQGQTPLYLAAYSGDADVTHILLKAGADVDTQEKNLGMRPLHAACHFGFFPIAKLLITYGAKVNSTNIDGETALFSASENKKNIDIMKYLISQNVDVNKKNISEQRTALHIASSYNHIKGIELLIENNGNIECATNIGMTPLIVASQYGHAEAVHLLLSKGANHRATTCQGYTALHYAVRSEHLKTIKHLLQAGADVNAETNMGISALDFIYDKQDQAILKVFSECGIQTVSEQEAQKAQQEFFAQLNKEEEEKQLIQHGKNYKKNQRKKLKKQEKKTIITNSDLDNTPEEILNTNLLQPTSIDQHNENGISPITSNELCPQPSTINTIQKEATLTLPQPLIKIPVKATNTSINLIKPADHDAKYQLLMHEKFKWPKSLRETQKNAIQNKLRQLKWWPNTNGLDITYLKGHPGISRLRVGNHRIIFSVDTTAQAIKIHEIALRKNVYKNIGL